MNDDNIDVTLQVIDVLESLGITYVIGGSLASTLHGVARTTLDSDLVADIKLEHIAAFVEQLQTSFYVSAPSIIDAIVFQSSFNLIHLATMFKVDIFIPKPRFFDRSQLANRTSIIVSHSPERTAYVASAEDTILAKLEWYRMGDELSERQWRDIIGVIRVQQDKLDIAYLREQAVELKVSDLLEKALNTN